MASVLSQGLNERVMVNQWSAVWMSRTELKAQAEIRSASSGDASGSRSGR